MSNKVLVVIAHSDDEVLGCGGTIINHVQNKDEVFVLVISDGESSRESHNLAHRKSCLEKSCSILGVSHFKQLNYEDSKLDSYPILDIIREIEIVSKTFSPNIIYTHSQADINIDHQVTSKATITSFRATPDSNVDCIYTFEIPSSTEWNTIEARSLFTPNHFVELNQDDVDKKFEALNCYEEEIRPFPHPRSLDYLTSLMKVRGGSIGVNYAEAFVSERVIKRKSK